MNALFVEVLRLCAAAGLVRVGMVAVDGTKMKANAALAANRTQETIEQEVARILTEAEAKDREEDELYSSASRGDELPAELRHRSSRLRRLRECKERLEQEEQRAQARQAEKVARRAEEENRSHKKKRGRKPKDPAAIVNPEARANVTDPDSRIMKTRSGYIQGYNAQAVVTSDQIVLAAELTQTGNDVHLLHPMIEQACDNLAGAGVGDEIDAVAADAGYWSEGNYRRSEPGGPELFIATAKDHEHRQAMRVQDSPRGRIPKQLRSRARMRRKLLTKRGRAIYKLRGQTVEPVFGQIKEGQRFGRFARRGRWACDSEWKFACTVRNLLKLWRKCATTAAASSRVARTAAMNAMAMA